MKFTANTEPSLKPIKAYYYHENDDSIFIDHLNRDFGPYTDSIHKIGLCFYEDNRKELIRRLWNRKRKGSFKGLLLSKCNVQLHFPDLPF